MQHTPSFFLFCFFSFSFFFVVSEDVSTGIQDFIITIEMFLMSLLHLWAFPWSEFHDPTVDNTAHQISVASVLIPHDVLRDVKVCVSCCCFPSVVALLLSSHLSFIFLYLSRSLGPYYPTKEEEEEGIQRRY
jgi:hypothetical protein